MKKMPTNLGLSPEGFAVKMIPEKKVSKRKQNNIDYDPAQFDPVIDKQTRWNDGERHLWKCFKKLVRGIRWETGETSTSMANRLGIDRSSLLSYESAKYAPKNKKFFSLFIKKYGDYIEDKDREWLLYFEKVLAHADKNK